MGSRRVVHRTAGTLRTQTVVWTDEQQKRAALLEQLSGVSGRTIVFVETKREAEQLEEFLYASRSRLAIPLLAR